MPINNALFLQSPSQLKREFSSMFNTVWYGCQNEFGRTTSIQLEMPLVFCPAQQCPKSEVWGIGASCEHQNLVVRKTLPGEALSITAISRAGILGGITSFSQLAVPNVYPETLVCVLLIKSLRCSIWGRVVSTATFHSVFSSLYLVFQWSVLASIWTAGSHDSKHNGLHNNPVAFIDTLSGKSTFMGM